ncbi:hypothetical protein K3555_13595 [Leisingera sp. M527]|uniref:hypothetical protein n=1 Tax=Leisingera sp. M527 TaxID=2867014 RepID=UPI0021A8CD01|nr:hypothetical protein [Leisingera sp. M527]UWQ31627.1 hypothetical protein K3555_13595 [Leisingera sp. M527]
MSIRLALLVLLGTVLVGCGDTDIQYPEPYATEIKALEAELTSLNAELKPLATPILQPGTDLSVWLASKIITDEFDRFNSRPASQRTARFRSDRISGRFAEDNWDCGWFGRGGWYVAPRDPRGHWVNAQVRRISYSWNDATGLRFRIPVFANAGTKVKYHFDPCLGGGVGWNGAGIGDARGTIVGSFQIIQASKDSVRLRLSIENNPRLNIRLIIAGLPIPVFAFFRTDAIDLAGPLFDTSLSPIVAERGEIELPDGSSSKTVPYEIVVSGTQVELTEGGYEVEFDVALEVE